MTATSSTAGAVRAAPTPPRLGRRIVWASFVGTALESFDFYLYAYFAATLAGPLFFEPLGRFGGTLAAFLSIGVGFIVRPVGAIVFGHLGDRIGRRRTLLLTITIMGLSTGLIGVLPSYAVAGWLGAIAIVVLRLLQGFSLGGEWGGAVLLATEHAAPAKRAFAAAMPQLGSPVGSILVAGLFLISSVAMPTNAFSAWGWRIPFLVAFPLLLVSLYLRSRIDETPVFRELLSTGARARLPILAALRAQPVGILVAVAAALLGIGSYSLMNTYTINYGVTVLGFSYTDLLIATTIGGLLQLVTIPLFGRLANRVGSARVVAIGALGTLLVAFPLYYVLQFATFPILVGTMIIGGILPTMSWAALGGLMNDLFGGSSRYSALAFAYSIAAVVSGFVPSITLALANATSDAWWHPGIVLGVMSAITLAGAVAAGSRRLRAHAAG